MNSEQPGDGNLRLTGSSNRSNPLVLAANPETHCSAEIICTELSFRCFLFIDGDCAVHSYRRNRFQLCARSISSAVPWGIKLPTSFAAIAGIRALAELLPTR
ncbi:hypothetical protein E2320_010199 [Naja naja]|nr:hypothetical protein E2320_010199 [Naja naja]